MRHGIRIAGLVGVALCSALVVLPGCGSGGGSLPAAGRLSLQIAFPSSRQQGGGLPPGATAVRIQLTGAGNFHASKTVTAPAPGGTATADFLQVPPGALHIHATAHSDPAAATAPLAAADTDTTIQPGQISKVTLSFSNAQLHLDVTPNTANLAVGAPATIVTASIKDAANSVVSGLPVIWSSSNSLIASVTPSTSDSTSASVSGLSAGSAVITARQPGLGLTGQSTVVVSNAPPAAVNAGSGFTPGATGGITFNGNAKPAGALVRLTDGGGYEVNSLFTKSPVNIRSFNTQFDFQITPAGAGTADGLTFTIQNNSPSIVGEAGGGLGYGGIGKSVAVKFDLYNNAGEGVNSTGIYQNGAYPSIPSIDLTPARVDLHSGHVMRVKMMYDGTHLMVSITDLTTNATASQNYPVDIPAVVGGSTAYVGFTGATGSLTSTQDILNWNFTAGGLVDTAV